MRRLIIVLKKGTLKLKQHLSLSACSCTKFIQGALSAFKQGALISFAFVAALPFSVAHALVLNDIAANDFGGIEHYWDRENKFPSVVSLYYETPFGGYSSCSGTLVAPRIVMTAAHCLEFSNGYDSKNLKIRFSQDAHLETKHDRSISNFYMHPKYDRNHGFSDHDIAFVVLDRPVVDVQPTKIHIDPTNRGSDPQLYFAGYGIALAASSKDRIHDSRRRVGNITSGVAFIYGDYYEYATIFRNPLLGSSNVDYGIFGNKEIISYLESMPYYGDSGGPLFIKGDDGEYYQIALVKGGSETPGKYGSVDFWTPLSLFREWYFENNPVKDVATYEGSFTWSDYGSWNNSHIGAVIPDNIHVKAEAYSFATSYYNVYISPGSSIDLDRDITIDALEIKGPNASLLIRENHTLTTLAGTSLYNGYLTVDGELSTALMTVSQSVVDGRGTISASSKIVNEDGKIIPGHHDTSGVITPGVLTFYGDYYQMEGATLVSHRANEQAGRLDIGGIASLGGVLHVSGKSDHYDSSRQYQVVFATEGIHGRFNTVTTNSVFLDADVTYKPYNVSYRLVRNSTPFATFADNASAAAVARALETVATDSKIYQAIVNMNYDEPAFNKLGHSFSMLSGETHASAIQVVYGAAGIVRDSVLQRLRLPQKVPTYPVATVQHKLPEGFQPAERFRKDGHYFDPQHFTIWGTGVGSWAQSHRDGGSAGLKTLTGGFIIGAEASPDQAWRVGAASGFLQSAFHINSRNDKGKNGAVFGAVYGSGSFGDAEIRVGASYTHDALTVERFVKVGSYTDALAASRSADAIQSFGELGYRTVVGNDIRIEPLIGGSFLRVKAGSFSERGGDSALNGAGRTYDLGSTMVALKGEMLTGEASPLIVRSTIGWRHAFGHIRPELQLAFAQGSDAFSISGSPVDRHAFVMEAEAEWQVARDVSMSVAAGGQIGRKNTAHTLKGNVVWRF